MMLETVDFSQEDVSKDDYKRCHDQLVEKLVVLQQQARQQGIGLVVLFEGWNGAGKGSRISDLMYNLDARATSVHVTGDLDAKGARSFPGLASNVRGFNPFMQEFWRSLGERGTITFYDRGWYTTAVQQGLYLGRKGSAKTYLASIGDFERQLVDDGYVVVKFFVHMTKKGQKKRLNKLHDNPATRWRVSEDKLSRIGNYDKAYALYDLLLEKTDFDYAPWKLLNGENRRSSNIVVAEALVNALEQALAPSQPAAAEAEPANEPVPVDAVKLADSLVAAISTTLEEGASSAALPVLAGNPASGIETERVESSAPAVQRELADDSAAGTVVESDELFSSQAPQASRFEIEQAFPQLETIDHTLALDKATYKLKLKKLQKRLYVLENEMYQKRVPLVIMYEGWDAAGKGGNIKRVAQALDARAYTIFPSPAPTKPELAHPHLWRYWTRLPKAGHVGIYDRSWYGRVLVERVEGFATPSQWARAYDEINEFERDLVEWGAILLKFWVDVSDEEQLRRFHERQDDPAKQWKITDDDWRNRERRPQYEAAIKDMFRLTSTEQAPWIILESDDKRFARVKALKIIVDALEARLHES